MTTTEYVTVSTATTHAMKARTHASFALRPPSLPQSRPSLIATVLLGIAATMSDLRARIDEINRNHLLIRYDRRAWWCQCGDDSLSVEGSHYEHVTDVLIRELRQIGCPAPDTGWPEDGEANDE